MVDAALARARLVAQGLVTRPYPDAAAAVAAFGAMQGQDLPGVMASVALRLPGASGPDGVAAVVAAMDAGEIVRAYPMRGTVFLMAAADAAWVSELCNAAQLRGYGRRHQQLGITAEHLASAEEVVHEVLAGDRRRIGRTELMARWAERGVPVSGGHGYNILSWFITRGDVVFGPWNGTDQDVVLASSWLPSGSTLAERFGGERVPAVAELLRRYLASHGPATVRDFAWWTKLPLAEIRAGLALVADRLEGDGDRYWRPGLLDEVEAAGGAAHELLLLPGFDEFVLGYTDRLFAMTADEHARLVPGNNGVFGRAVVVDGVVRGIWKRGGRPGRRSLEVAWFGDADEALQDHAERRWADFPFVGA